MPICHLRALIHNMCGGNSNTAGLGSRVLRPNRWQPSDRTQLHFRYLSRPRWCTEQRRSGTSTAALHPGFTGARAESHGGATSHVPELLMVEWVYEVPQVRSSAEPLPAIFPCQINCNRSLQTSTAEEAKERTLTLDSILPWTSNLRNVVADEQHENIRGDCIRNVSVCGGHGLLFSRRRVSAVPSVGARIRFSCLARPAPHRHQQCA